MRSRFMLCWQSFSVAVVAAVTKTKLTVVQFSDQMFLFLSRWSTLQPRPLFSKFRTHRRRRTTRATRWNNETEARTIMWKKAEQTNFTKKVIFSVPSLFIRVAAFRRRRRCRRRRCRRLFCRLQMKSLFSVFLLLLFCWLSLYRLLRLTLEKSSGREPATIGRKLNKDLLEKMVSSSLSLIWIRTGCY